MITRYGRTRQQSSPRQRALRRWALVVLVLGLAGVAAWQLTAARTNTTDDSGTLDNSTANQPAAALSDNQVVNVNRSVMSNSNTNVNAGTNPAIPSTNLNASLDKPQAVSANEISRIQTDGKIVVFTFDAGSGDSSLEQILAALAEYDIQATFFVTGNWAEQYPFGVREMVDQGHEVFNHTFTHPHLPGLLSAEIKSELDRTDAFIKDLTGKSTKPYFRVPYGDRNAFVLETAAQAGYQSVYWTVDALDWKESEGVTAAQVKQRVLDNLKPGAVVLMHVGDAITGSIVDSLFSEIESTGFMIRSLGQALHLE